MNDEAENDVEFKKRPVLFRVHVASTSSLRAEFGLVWRPNTSAVSAHVLHLASRSLLVPPWPTAATMTTSLRSGLGEPLSQVLGIECVHRSSLLETLVSANRELCNSLFAYFPSNQYSATVSIPSSLYSDVIDALGVSSLAIHEE